jgi:integrase
MKKAGVAGVHFVRALRPGKPVRWFVYAWRGGPCIMKHEGAMRPSLDRAALAALSTAQAADGSPDPTLLRSVVHAWRCSPEWKALAPGTRKTWGHALGLIEDRWEKTPLELWSDSRMTAKIVKWRDERSSTPRAADIGVTVLRALLDHARLNGRVRTNVANDIPTLYRGGDRAEIVWTTDDIDAFATAAHRLNKLHVLDGLRLAALTGLRRQDLVTLTWAQIGDFAIQKRALKRSGKNRRRQHATIPRIPALNALLTDLRTRHRANDVQTLLVNSYGHSWTGDGFGGSFNAVRDAAQIMHVEDDDTGQPIKRRKHLHDVRGTFCTNLILEGLTDDAVAERMAWSAQRVAAIRRVYVDDARVVVAMGERIANNAVKRVVKRS